MADKRYFAKIDVGYFDNPKIADVLDEHPSVVLLHLRAILYCRQHLTNGVFPIRQVTRLVGATWCGTQCAEECGAQCGDHYESQCAGECGRMCDVHLSIETGLFECVDAPNRAYVHDYLKHQESAEAAEERKANASKASRARWGKQKGAADTPSDAPSNAPRNASSNASSNASGNAEERRGEERRSSANALQRVRETEAFTAFWKAYPRKVGKGAAEKAWTKAVKADSPDTILAGLTEQLPTLRMQKRPDGDYRPHPATWLNEKRWQDTPDTTPAPGDTRTIPNEHWERGGGFDDDWRNR